MRFVQRTRLSRVSIFAFASFYPANTRLTAIVWTESSGTIFASPIIFAEARIINTLSVMSTIIRAIRDRKFCMETI